MGALAGAPPEMAYADRLERLRQRRIALWDVCASAFRAGSLDKSIVLPSVVPNDFAAFLAAHPQVALIGFNGRPAGKLYEDLVLKTLAAGHRRDPPGGVALHQPRPTPRCPPRRSWRSGVPRLARSWNSALAPRLAASFCACLCRESGMRMPGSPRLSALWNPVGVGEQSLIERYFSVPPARSILIFRATVARSSNFRPARSTICATKAASGVGA